MPDRSMHDWPEILVPFDGSSGAEKVLRRACRAARRDAARLTVLCLAMLPTDDETAWSDPDLDVTALRALTAAQVICREEGAIGVFQLSHGRSLADVIVEEARRSGAALIGLSLEEHDPGETVLMSETVRQVLASAPCTVLLEDPYGETVPCVPAHPI
jgi:nucleotide-binding universal stress UspA family protein